MDISAGLIAKGTAGALAASAAVGGGVWANENDWFGLLPSGDASKSLVNGEGSSNRQPSEEAAEVAGGEGTQEGSGVVGSVVEQATGSSGGRQGETLQSSERGTPEGKTVTATDSNGSPGGDIQTSDLTDTSQNQGHGQSGKTSETEQQTKITKWDEALISYLREENKDDRDIAFDIKTGKSTSSEALSTTFPNFETDEQRKKLTINVSVTTTSSGLKGTDSNSKIAELKKMNGGETNGKEWTWKCKVVLSKDATDTNEFPDKEKLIGDNGYFNRLKKLVSGESDETSKKNLKELKAKFIENCAKSRDDAKSKEYKEKTTLENNEKIISEKVFKLQKDKSGTNLKIKDDDFSAWFQTTLAQAQ